MSSDLHIEVEDVSCRRRKGGLGGGVEILGVGEMKAYIFRQSILRPLLRIRL